MSLQEVPESPEAAWINDLQFCEVMGGGATAEIEARARYARLVEPPAVIVEIGVLRGQGLCAFAVGSKHGHQVRVYGIDLFGMRPSGQGPTYDDPKNLRVTQEFVKRLGVGELVSLYKQESVVAAAEWRNLDHPIGVLEIDAGHEYHDVLADFKGWAGYVPVGGMLLMHDARNAVWAGVDRVINEEILASGQWEAVEFVAPFSAWFRRTAA